MVVKAGAAPGVFSAMLVRLAWRFFRREFVSGELRLLFAALVVAVAAVSAVAFFADRVRLALDREANQMLGADLLLIADHPWPESLVQAARQRGLQTAETRMFPSMVRAGERLQLAEIKAASPGYPLRGQLRTAPTPGQAGQAVKGGPTPGSVWVDERLATSLGIVPGDVIQVGQKALRLASLLTLEPDKGVNFFGVAPRLLMALDDLAATGLVQSGSRVTYRLLVAGEDAALAAFRSGVESSLARGERIEDASNARPEIRTALERARRFLGLSSLLAVILGATAVALAARRYGQRHLDTCAVLRCLGASQGSVVGLHGVLFLWLALVAAVLGLGVGYGGHFLLHAWLAPLLASPLPPPSWTPAGQGAAVAFVLLFGFALPPILRLKAVPVLRVIRRDLGLPNAAGWGALLAAGGAVFALIYWAAGEASLALRAGLGFVVALGVFVVLARLAVATLAWWRPKAGRGTVIAFGWRQGAANLARHAWGSTVQIAALAVGLLALCLLTVTRADLLAAWQMALPPDAPNRFLINIQPDQRQAVQESLRAAGIRADLAPMVRARLQAIGDKTVSASSYPDDERAQRLVEREFNLSWRDTLPPGNRVVGGVWQSQGAGASVEEGLAKTLGIRIGDPLRFAIAGETVTVTVSSLRKLDWDSMRVNFFVLTPPGVLEDYPASYITSFHLPADQQALPQQWLARFPNLTLIDVAAIVAQLQGVLAQVASAVEFVVLFALAAGGLVLYAALAVVFDERRAELALLRALGAVRRQLRHALLTELALIGALAGLLAAGAALVIGQVLAAQVFQLSLPWRWELLPGGMALGALFSTGVGAWGIRRLLQVSPILALRQS